MGLFTGGVTESSPGVCSWTYPNTEESPTSPRNVRSTDGSSRTQPRPRGVELEPGDALVVHCGREAWQEAHPGTAYGPSSTAPGLHASCLPFIRDNDVSVLVWDMHDLLPSGYDLPWTVHGVLFAYGVAILDNALLQPLAEACKQEGRCEFMLMVAPLKVEGGTGSPVNPIALL